MKERYYAEIWEERDRIGIWVTDTATDDVIYEVWDDNCRQMFEDGFFKPGKELEASVLEYLKERGLISEKEVKVCIK